MNSNLMRPLSFALLAFCAACGGSNFTVTDPAPETDAGDAGPDTLITTEIPDVDAGGDTGSPSMSGSSGSGMSGSSGANSGSSAGSGASGGSGVGSGGESGTSGTASGSGSGAPSGSASGASSGSIPSGSMSGTSSGTAPSGSASGTSSGSVAVDSPTVSISPTVGPQGTTFTLSGTNFTPTGGVYIWYHIQGGANINLAQLGSPPPGVFTYGYQTTYSATASTPVGTYTIWAVDQNTGVSSNQVQFTVTAEVPDSGTSTGCTSNTECPVARPLCATTHECIAGCTTNAQCRSATYPVCDMTTGQCVAQ